MHTPSRGRRLAALLLAATMGAGPAFAGPPPGHEDHHDRDDHPGRHDKEMHHKDRYEGRYYDRPGGYFIAGDRDAVHRYYASHCPPGMARKHDGCQPPGHAKTVWVVGRPLPPKVVVAPVPQPILVTLPPPPPSHKYVQVAGDVLLVTVGTMMVVDGINGLSR